MCNNDDISDQRTTLGEPKLIKEGNISDLLTKYGGQIKHNQKEQRERT